MKIPSESLTSSLWVCVDSFLAFFIFFFLMLKTFFFCSSSFIFLLCSLAIDIELVSAHILLT